MKVLKTNILKSIVQEEFSPVMEHDSHEFLLYFLNNLKDELTEKNTKLPSLSQSASLDSLWREYSLLFPS